MGISLGTALEIFSNPTDLEFIVSQPEKDGKFAFSISRGPGHRGKLLISSQPFANTPEEAIETIKQLLEGIMSGCLEKFGPPTGDSKALDAELIARIIEELRQHRSASTWAMLAQTG